MVAAALLARNLIDLEGEGDETSAHSDVEEVVGLVDDILEVKDLSLGRSDLFPVVDGTHGVFSNVFRLKTGTLLFDDT